MSIESARENLDEAMAAWAETELGDDESRPANERVDAAIDALILEAQGDLIEAVRLLSALVRFIDADGHAWPSLRWVPGVTTEQLHALGRVNRKLAAKEAVVDPC